MKKTFLLILVIACGFVSASAMAQKFPSYYPAEFPETGIIDAANIGVGKILIDDSAYKIAPDAVVRSLSSREDSMARLRVGVRVGFKIRGDTITEFWLLPAKNGQRRRP